MLEESDGSYYSGKTRVRVCGILVEDERLLLVCHKGLGEFGLLWIPPGGGVEYQEPAEEALIREFQEETGLKINVETMLFVSEYIKPPLHAVELFFRVSRAGGTLKTGHDPEVHPDKQLIEKVDFLSWDEFLEIPVQKKHHILRDIDSLKALRNLSGYYRFP